MRDAHQAAIGARIAGLRDQQGWSQRALAGWVGIDQSAVSRIEAGRRRLSADELQRFADVLHVSADELLRGLPATAPPRAPAAGATEAPLVARALHPDLRRPAEHLVARADAGPRLETRTDDDAGPEWALDAIGTPDSLLEASRIRVSATPAAGGEGGSLRSRVGSGVFDAGEAERAILRVERADWPDTPALPLVAGLPDEAAAVTRDWFCLRRLAAAGPPAPPWSTGHSAEGKQARVSHTAASLRAGAPAGDVLFDRVARFWRSELHVAPDDGPLPDLVPLLEDGYGAQVIVARVAAGDRPVAAAFTAADTPFIFVNAARPVLLQRFALVHAFAHLVLGHGDVVDRRIEWSRTIPPEAAANDFAEELLAPVRAVRRWYERRATPRSIRLEDLLDLGNAFGISVWAALYRSRAAGRLQGKQFHVLRGDLERNEWQLLPRQTYLGGLKDTLAKLTPGETLPPGEYGRPAVLRVPAAMRAWALTLVRDGRLSLEEAAETLRVEPGALADGLSRMGVD